MMSMSLPFYLKIFKNCLDLILSMPTNKYYNILLEIHNNKMVVIVRKK